MTGRVPRCWRTDGERRPPGGTRSAVRHPSGGWRLAHVAASTVGDRGERLANEPEQLELQDELDALEGFDGWSIFDKARARLAEEAEPE